MKNYFIETAPLLSPFFPKPNWAKYRFGIEGASAIAFLGPASSFDVQEKGAPRVSSETLMWHVIVEQFNTSYSEMLLWQRLLANSCALSMGDPIYALQEVVAKNGHKIGISHSFWSQISCIFYLGIFLDQWLDLPSNFPKAPPLTHPLTQTIKGVVIESLQHYTNEYRQVQATLLQQGMNL